MSAINHNMWLCRPLYL